MSTIDLNPRLAFTKSSDRPLLDHPVASFKTAGNLVGWSEYLRLDNETGTKPPPPEPTGIANMVISAPHATPRAPNVCSMNLRPGFAIITLATVVP